MKFAVTHLALLVACSATADESPNGIYSVADNDAQAHRQLSRSPTTMTTFVWNSEVMRNLIPAITLAGALLVSGCGFAHDEHITGPYRLIAVDVDEQMSISYDLGDGSAIGRVDETVFAFGYDKRFLVAKQHPAGDRSITNYFYLDIAKDSKYAEPSDSVTGPLTQAEFEEEAKRIRIPGFTRTLTALE